jgi:hypothetical protein
MSTLTVLFAIIFMSSVVLLLPAAGCRRSVTAHSTPVFKNFNGLANDLIAGYGMVKHFFSGNFPARTGGVPTRRLNLPASNLDVQPCNLGHPASGWNIQVSGLDVPGSGLLPQVSILMLPA